MSGDRGAHRRDSDTPPVATYVLLVVLFIALGVVALVVGYWWVSVYCALALLATWGTTSAIRQIRRDRQ